MPAHPKPQPKAKKPGVMRSKPKTAPTSDNPAQVRAEKALDAKRAAKKPAAPPKVVKASTLAPKPKPAPSAKPAAPDGQSKSAMIAAMLSTAGGATSKEMEQATGWAAHSVRGLLGTMRKKGIRVVSTKLPKEPTIYRIEAAAASEDVI